MFQDLGSGKGLGFKFEVYALNRFQVFSLLPSKDEARIGFRIPSCWALEGLRIWDSDPEP